MTTSQAVSAASRSSISQSVYFMLQHSKNFSLDYEEIVGQWVSHFFEHATEEEKLVFREELKREIEEGSYHLELLEQTFIFILGGDTEVCEWCIAMLEKSKESE